MKKQTKCKTSRQIKRKTVKRNNKLKKTKKNNNKLLIGGDNNDYYNENFFSLDRKDFKDTISKKLAKIDKHKRKVLKSNEQSINLDNADSTDFPYIFIE